MNLFFTQNNVRPLGLEPRTTEEYLLKISCVRPLGLEPRTTEV